MERYWLIYDGIGAVEGSTGRYLVVLGQYRSVLIDSWWYWVNMERYWLIYDGTSSAEGGTVRYLVVHSTAMFSRSSWIFIIQK